uniref:Bifunctional inhibitor/plant lipid transfer protein/seed storage helical domain-containing protein n=1 Tax=Leersia perrieri TaxID=77586 RepID=A0A0D9XY68_9ORYZ
MVFAKVAGGVLLLLLLACFEAVPLPPAAFANDDTPLAPPPPPSTEECTHAQKVEILDKCNGYIRNQLPPITKPKDNSPCCDARRIGPTQEGSSWAFVTVVGPVMVNRAVVVRLHVGNDKGNQQMI